MYKGIIYYGGKLSLLPFIYKHMPVHKVWVDAFCGGGSVSFNKPQSEIEVINDRGFVVRFFKTLRDPIKGPELIRQLELTPYSREELYSANKWMWEVNDVEQSRMWFNQLAMGFNHEEVHSHSFHISKVRNVASSYHNRVEYLPYLVKRMKNFIIENLSFEELFPLYDTVETLWFFDPPYMDSSRAETGNYLYEMTEDQHQTMLDFAVNCKGMVMVCGYNSLLYSKTLTRDNGFELFTYARMGKIKNSSQGSTERIEHLWVKNHGKIGGLWS